MKPQSAPQIRSKVRDPVWWHLPLLLALSVGYESLFLHHGFNPLDEGWQLYAAMRMQAGGVLYDDVLWVFPPGHLLAAWFGQWLDPPGFVLARGIYAAFNTVLCVGIYFLGRRVMAPRFALLGAVLLAVAAPRSHMMQLLFGYRYLIFTVLALLAFDRRLRTGDSRWMIAAGALTGVAVCFRITPAFAAGCGIGVAVMASSRDPRRWLGDWMRFGVGIAGVVVPVVAWFAGPVGVATLWREIVIHPVGMLQPLPLPEIELVEVTRNKITKLWVALGFRVYLLLYAGYAFALARLWLRSAARREPFDFVLLLAVVIWGGVYYIRSMGRSDEPHLDSALPPVCLLLAHLLSLAFRRGTGRAVTASRRPWAPAAACLSVVAVWIFLLQSDTYLSQEKRGTHRLRAGGGRISLHSPDKARTVGVLVHSVREFTQPGDVILDLTASPAYYVLTERMGPGYLDTVMLGTFRSPEEERAYIERLERSPPALVIWPNKRFDKMPERALGRVAPQLKRWLFEHYRQVGREPYYSILLPIEDGPEPTGIR